MNQKKAGRLFAEPPDNEQPKGKSIYYFLMIENNHFERQVLLISLYLIIAIVVHRGKDSFCREILPTNSLWPIQADMLINSLCDLYACATSGNTTQTMETK